MLLTLLLRYLANGGLWFALGFVAVALTVMDLAGRFDRRPIVARAAGFVFLLSCGMGALCGTPLPLPLAAFLLSAVAMHALRGFHHPARRVRRTSASAFIVICTLALAYEAPFMIGPDAPPGGPPRTLIVLGDSLSAGGYGESRTWPQILAEEGGIDVRNLSKDGQTIARALADARAFFSEEARAGAGPGRPVLESSVPQAVAPDATLDGGTSSRPRPDAWVLIELGGNDVLGGSTLSVYTDSLDHLLALCRGAPTLPRTVLMLEIPGVPGRWGFAAAQRRLAARHGVVLVPRRVLANVVFAPGSTGADVLHLTERGQQRFADAIRPWLGLGTERRGARM